MGRLHAFLSPRRKDGICFRRVDGLWHMLASVFDWTSGDFNGATSAEEEEIAEFNGELMRWHMEAELTKLGLI